MNVTIGPSCGGKVPSEYPVLGRRCHIAIDSDSGTLGLYSQKGDGDFFVPLVYALTTDRFRVAAYSIPRLLEEADGAFVVSEYSAGAD